MTVAPMQVTAISGVGGKSPACFLVETGSARFLLDLGEGAPGVFPNLARVGTIDAVLVSHGHADHIGGLHLIDQIGNPPIFATAVTRSFAGHPHLAAAHALPLNGRIDIAGISVETGRAGHAAGAVWMRLGGEHGVLYSGDLCRESLLYPVDTPLPAHTLIADASYGNYDQDLSAATSALIARAQNGPLLLPLPPTGRGLEIAVLLHEAGLPVSLCAQHRHIASLVLNGSLATLYPEGPSRLAGMLAAAAALEEDSAPAGVMIAANGAATAGLSATLLQRFMPIADIAIVLTGHVDSGTPAKSAIAAGRADFLRWNVHPRLRDLLWLCETVRPSNTILAFCEPDSASELADRLPPAGILLPVQA